MRLVITRPKHDARAVVKRLKELGHASWQSPVMDISWCKVQLPRPDELSGLIITSRNALRSLEQWNDLSPYNALPLFAVGKASANAARKRGFSNVLTAQGRADTLPALIKAHLKAPSAPLYHPGGQKLAFDLSPVLQENGFQLISQAVYETRQITRLAPIVRKGLLGGTVDGVLLMSPRTARLFCAILQNNKLQQHVSAVSALCLSQNVAEAASTLPWRQTLIAPHPDMDHLLGLVEQIDTK